MLFKKITESIYCCQKSAITAAKAKKPTYITSKK
jgi:hypothetical protein